MGCGSSKSLDVPSGPSDYKYMVQKTWDRVKGTVDSNMNGDMRKLVVRRSGWKTVRIFVSSTFKDFHAEREVLVKEVFPDLRTWCEKRRIHLVDCDLRWGVPKDTKCEETLRTCLGEIDRCYQDNIMPFFLNLTSERCGWIPTAHDVPEALSREYRWVHGLSVTEMEILHGAYRIDNPNAFFMIRDQSFLQTLPSEFKDEFVDPNPIAPHKMEVLKQMLRERLGSRVHWYNVEYSGVDDDGKVELNGLQENFSKLVYDFFLKRIEEQYPLLETNLDPYQTVKEAHESFLKSRGGSVLGRNEILEQIQTYVTSSGDNRALVMSGGAGCGKSSIMARTADVAQTMALNKRIPGGGETGWHVFYHFVGAIPGSTSLELCLKRLLKELKAFNEATMPKNLEACCQLACGVLSNPKTQPLIVIIDALNQFDDDKTTSVLSWLPRKLAPQVRVILAMIDDTPPHKELHERAIKPQEIIVTPLDMSARQQIVTDMLGKYNKKLGEDQMASLLSKESSQNPLWLSVACEELRVFGLFAKVTDKINSLADGLLELLEQVFTRFEEENGGMLLVATLCLLECSATGLLETELLLILGDEDNLMPADKDEDNNKDRGEKEKANKDASPLPAAKWAVVYRALKPFIRPFGDSGEGRLDFYHRALSKAVRKKYFDNTTAARVYDRTWWHKRLADFFTDVKSVERKVEELPIHLLAIQDKNRLQKFLTDWEVFDNLYNEDYSTVLLKYWREGFGAEWQGKMLEKYKESMQKFADEHDSREDIARRYEQVSRVINQSGKHMEALALLEKAMEIELSELGARPERMVELYHLACTVYDEKLKLYEYVDPAQLKELRPAINFARKSIAIRETLEGEVHKYKHGRTLIQLAFNLQAWMECGGDNALSPVEAIAEAKVTVVKAVDIFKELGSDGHLADATMTKGVLEERGCQEQVDLYMEALDLCLQAYGEFCVLTSRLYLNIGIMYEDRRSYREAYHWFIKWQDVCEEVFGYHHPRTQRCRNCLKEPRYVYVARQVEAEEAKNRRNAENGNEAAEDRGLIIGDDHSEYSDSSDGDY
nr:telomerase protein component 1-like isoform X2 [Lytechinus pictus]